MKRPPTLGYPGGVTPARAGARIMRAGIHRFFGITKLFGKKIMKRSIPKIVLLVACFYTLSYIAFVRSYPVAGGGHMPWIFPWTMPQCHSWQGDPMPSLVGSLQKKELVSRMAGGRKVFFYPLLRIDNLIIREGHWQEYFDENLAWESRVSLTSDSGHLSLIEPPYSNIEAQAEQDGGGQPATRSESK
jgi:hypothetical protein